MKDRQRESLGLPSEMNNDDTADQDTIRNRSGSYSESQTKRPWRYSDASIGEGDPFDVAEDINVDLIQSQDSLQGNNDNDTSATGAMTPMLSASPSPQKQNRRDRIQLYYTTGSFYSIPIAFMAYTLLSTQLRCRLYYRLLCHRHLQLVSLLVHQVA